MAAMSAGPAEPKIDSEVMLMTALARLDREAARLVQVNDQAMANAVGGYAMAVRALAHVVAEARIDTSARLAPLVARLERMAAWRAMPSSWRAIVTALHWPSLLILAGMLLAAAAGGYWWRGRLVTTAQVTNCHPVPQPEGGEAFTCTFWTHVPTRTQR
jgi:hypothetical protein